MITFFIHGHPAPGGSKTFFPVWRRDGTLVTEIRNNRVWPIIRVVDDAGEGNKRWKAACTIQGRAFMQGRQPFKAALEVEFTFNVLRPKIHFRTGKFSNELREDAPKEPVSRPDALKLTRSTEDALTGVIWNDDSQSVTITTRKRYRLPDEYEGCRVMIRPLYETF